MTVAVRYGQRLMTAGRALGHPTVITDPRDAVREMGGAFRVHGTVDELGVVGAYRVRLYFRDSGRLAAETWSADDGTFELSGVPYLPGGYFAIAHDHTDPLHNAAISDFITPEPIPT